MNGKCRNIGVLVVSVVVVAVAGNVTAASFEGLGNLSGGYYCYSEARGVSADGSVVVGVSSSEAFRWTAESGMVGLGGLGGGWSSADGVSGDGLVVVGAGQNGPNPWDCGAFRWTTEGGMVGLVGGNANVAYGASADGSIVVGERFWAMQDCFCKFFVVA